ncbi:MAG TPA: hypothetical protein VFF69_06165 [Phycisphaerales bacterium]|nr:hypothetical protein [Phycisphaerales bacterium]
MTSETDAPLPGRSSIAPAADPLWRRVAMCLIWFAAYGLAWWFVVFRPLPHVAWVNLAVVGAILVSNLPPARIRPFAGAASFLALGAIMVLVINNTLYAIVLGMCAVFALSDGILNLHARRREETPARGRGGSEEA